jgi:anaerobic dimethyl sulfoxide reductase subunit B (iron-sulfur subunit)
MKQMAFYFDQNRCIGCYTCSVACKDWNNITSELISWRTIKIIEKGKFPNLFLAYYSYSCYHCKDPLCIKVCSSNAIIKRKQDGIVIVNEDFCIGKEKCGCKCLHACPYDIPQFGSEENAKMQKCNFCFERLDQGQQTICVEACPMYALDAGPLDELERKYGDKIEAEGFKYVKKLKPSIILSPKLDLKST